MTQNTEFNDEVVSATTSPEIVEEVQVEEVQVEAVAAAPRKRRRFWPWLCVYTVLLLAAAAFSLRQLHTYLQTYESQTPNNTLTQFLNWIETKNYEEMYAYADFEETVLNTKAEYLRYLERTYGEAKGALSLREQEGSSQDKQLYTVYAGETPLSQVVLLKNPAWGETPFTIYTVCEPIEEVTIVVQADTRVSINGTDLALLNLPAEEVQTTLFAGMPEGVELPVVHQYTIKGLLNPPQIAGLTLGGETCTVQTKGETVYHVSHPASAEEIQVQEQLAMQVMEDYANFTAGRLSAREFKKYLHKPSDLYQTISNFTDFIEPKPTSFGCGQFTVSDHWSLTSQDFSCTVQFMQGMTQKGPEGTLATDNLVSYRLTFFKMEEEWKLLSINRADVDKK